MQSSEGVKGGLHSNTFTNLDLPRAGTWVFKDPVGHVTGVFGSNPLESTSIMIYKTKSKNTENIQVKLSWVHDLPDIVA